MTHMNPGFLDHARAVFAGNPPPSLARVRDRVARESTGTKRRDHLSALATLARVMAIDLQNVKATPAAVRTLLSSRNALELGLSERRWRNVRSAVAATVRAFGVKPNASLERVPINGEWTGLLARIETKHHRDGMTRLARFCSAMRISPEAVDRDTLLGFYHALDTEELIRDPRQKLKHSIAIWNMCHRRVAGWPDCSLSSPFERNVIALPVETFPQRFRDDLARWREGLLNPDLMDPAAPPRPLKPVTVDNKTAQILRFASALVHRECLPIDAITGLDVLVSDIDRFKQGLRFFLDRFDGQANGYIANIGDCLRGIARHYVHVPDETHDAMEAICKRLRPPRNEGLKPKNRERLRQFDDPANVERLLQYPRHEAERGRKHKNPYRAAKCFERAVAVSVLLATGLRIKNLRTINRETDLSRADGRCFLSIPGDRVKNGMDLDYELPPETDTLLREYVRDYRPRFPGAEGPYLFPGRDGGPRPNSTMANDIKTSLYKRAGLTMNPHLFRHAIAKIVIERDPGLAFAISRHLGHKNINTTMQAYLGTEGRAAARSIDRVLKQAMVNPRLPEA